MSSVPSLETIRWIKPFVWWLRIQPNDDWIHKCGFQQVSDMISVSLIGPQNLCFWLLILFSPPGSTYQGISNGDTEFTFLMTMSLILHLYSNFFIWRTSLSPFPANHYLSLVSWLLVHSRVNYSNVHLKRQAIWFVTYLAPERMKTMHCRIHVLTGEKLFEFSYKSFFS